MTEAAPEALVSRSDVEACYELQRGDASGCTAAAWAQLHRGRVPVASAARWLDLELGTELARAWVAVPAALPCFAGHFPGQPVLPGVLQLVWARELLACWQPDAVIGTVSRLKFRQRVEPPAVLRFELHRSAGKIAARVERPAGTVADWVFAAGSEASAGTD